MADKKISQLTSATTLTGAELVPVVQAGATVQTPVSNVIVATAGYTPSGTGAVARSVASKLGESVSVKDFGAVGDGVTDDTAAIQAALTYMASINGGTLLFPSGTYALTDVGGEPRPVGPGAGPAPSGTQPTKFSVTSVNDLTLTGGGKLKLLRTASGGGTYDAYNWNFFQFNSCARLKIHGLSFEGNRTIPIADINFNGEQGDAIRLNACTDVQITDNYFTLVSINSIRVMADSKRVVVDGNVAYDGNDAFIQVGDGSSAAVANDPTNVVVSNNVIDQFYTDAGIKVRYSAHNVVIDGNDIIAYQGGATQNPPALMVRGKTDADDRVTDIVVSNNRMEASATAAAAVSMADSFASNGRYPKNVTFSGNSIKGAVTLKGTNIKLLGNIIEGIVSQTLAADVEISDNRITYNGAGAQRAIDLSVTGDYAAIVNTNRIVTDGTGHTVICTNITRVSFCNNVVEKNGTTTGSNNQLEIYVPADGDAVISGNQFYQAASYRLGSCIRVNGQGANSDVSIIGNTFRNAGAYSIRRAAALSGAGVVVGCTSYGPTTGDYLDSTGTYTKTGCTF